MLAFEITCVKNIDPKYSDSQTFSFSGLYNFHFILLVKIRTNDIRTIATC